MSALGGILMFDGTPVNGEALASLGARLERFEADSAREVIAGAMGMTYRAFHTTVESRRERQPYSRDGAVLCFDGRLDNREELLRELRIDLRGDDTDAAIAMAAFMKWRVDGIARLLGDFALAISDPGDRAVWLARDCVGARTLYYHVNGRRLIWSTYLGALLDQLGPPFDIDDEYVADLLTRGPTAGGTPYVSIHAVKPAHAVRVGEDGFASEQEFWALDVNREIRYRTDAEFEEHFRTVFCDAVRCRLRSDRPIFAELSGGLDSSSIVCVAHHLLERGDAVGPALETLSFVFDDAPTADERRWIAHVDEWRGRSGIRLSDRTHMWFGELEDTSGVALPNTILSGPAHLHGVRAAMREKDARVLLAGSGGDELLHSRNDPMPELADLAAAWDVRRLHRRLRTWGPLLGRSYWELLWQDAVLPNLPMSIQARLGRGPVKHLPDWLDEPFVRRMRLRERMVEQPWNRLHARPSARFQARRFQLARSFVASGNRQETGGCDVAFPYLDRRLVEYLQATPMDQKLRCGQSRSIMRRGLRGLVPDAILSRRGKGDPTEAVFRGLRREAERFRRFLTDARIVQRGYVDPHKFRTAFDRAIQGQERYAAKLVKLLTIEMWLRAVERRSAARQAVATGGERAAAVVAIGTEAAL